MKSILRRLAAALLMITACTAQAHPSCSCVPVDQPQGSDSSGSSGGLDTPATDEGAPCTPR